jgi:hypothetical protein
MSSGIDYHVFLWLSPMLVISIVLGRTLWVYLGSRNWPTADGAITRLDVQRKQDAGRDGGHYTCATFTYEFQDLEGRRQCGTWYKNFSTEAAARDFAVRELPLGKQVLVRFNPKDPGINDLELDSSTYTNDRPTSLNL